MGSKHIYIIHDATRMEPVIQAIASQIKGSIPTLLDPDFSILRSLKTV